MFDKHSVELDWGGRKLTLETGKVARQADGAVIATYGETTVLATVVAAKAPKPGIDFMPLTVNYTEKYYAAGRIPGGYFKRERGPTEKDTLTSRLIDRPIRPLFPDGWRCDTQVTVTVMSHDQENDPDIVALVATSAALTLSGIPFMGPIGAARVGFSNNEYVLNPTIDEMKETKLDLVVAGTSEAVLMVESEAQELSEEVMLGAVMFGHRHFQPVINAIIQLAEKCAKEPREFAVPDNAALEKEMLGLVEADLRKAYSIPKKAERYEAVGAVKKKAMAHYFPDGKDNPERPMTLIGAVFKELEAKIVRWNILDTGKAPVDYHYLSYPFQPDKPGRGLHGNVWNDRARKRKDILLDEEMSSQGSCWFMHRDHWDTLIGPMQCEGYGRFAQEFQELGNKTWLSSGKVMINKKAWYAHLHKGSKYGRGYAMSSGEMNRGVQYAVDLWVYNQWDHPKRVHDFAWLINHFWPVPTWPENWESLIPPRGTFNYSMKDAYNVPIVGKS